jgi:hypothetical protein
LNVGENEMAGIGGIGSCFQFASSLNCFGSKLNVGENGKIPGTDRCLISVCFLIPVCFHIRP